MNRACGILRPDVTVLPLPGVRGRRAVTPSRTSRARFLVMSFCQLGHAQSPPEALNPGRCSKHCFTTCTSAARRQRFLSGTMLMSDRGCTGIDSWFL